MKMLAPVALFAFKRLDNLKACVESLKASPQSVETSLTVFVDGARANVPGEIAAVEEVRSYAESISGFLEVRVIASESNKGLAASIIQGVSYILEQNSRVIVLEDDLVLSPSFLLYMNTMLDFYENDKRIMQVSGFGPSLGIDAAGIDVYLNRRGESWSWGIWKDRWESIDWEVSDYESFKKDRKAVAAFNDIGSDLFGMLKDYKAGKNSSWAIRLCYSAFKQGKFILSPVRSLARNDGFGAGATHSRGYNRYKVDFEDNIRAYVPIRNIDYKKSLDIHANRYWNLMHRIFGKIIGFIYGRC